MQIEEDQINCRESRAGGSVASGCGPSNTWEASEEGVAGFSCCRNVNQAKSANLGDNINHSSSRLMSSDSDDISPFIITVRSVKPSFLMTR